MHQFHPQHEVKQHLFPRTCHARNAALILCALSLLTSCEKPALNVGPGDYYLIRTSQEEVQISPTGYNPDSTPVIPKTVQAYATDGHWIIARTTNAETDDPPPASESLSYWILDASKKSLHGPLSLQEFTRAVSRWPFPLGSNSSSVKILNQSTLFRCPKVTSPWRYCPSSPT